jgi:hypothetical protein
MRKLNAECKMFVILFVVQLFSYGMVTYNYRMIAQMKMVEALGSDAMIGSANYFIIRKIAKDENPSFFAWLGYMLGGVVGTYLGMHLSLWLHWS